MIWSFHACHVVFIPQSMLLAVPADITERTMYRVRCSVVSCPSMECCEDSIRVRLLVVTTHVVCHWPSLMMCLGGCLLFYHVHGWNCGESCLIYWGMARSHLLLLSGLCGCHSDQDCAVLEIYLMLCSTITDLSGWYSCICYACSLHLSWWHVLSVLFVETCEKLYWP
jgi:hypothetical protein